VGWVVKSWRGETLARETLAAAEHEARRLRCDAVREYIDAAAYLEELERFGEQTLADVRGRRRLVRPPEAAPVPRRARATMRNSPLGELFRATAPR
jgi:hypothetical protein